MMRLFFNISLIVAILAVPAVGFCQDLFIELENRIAELESEVRKPSSPSEKEKHSINQTYLSSQTRLDSHEERIQQLENKKPGRPSRDKALASARGCPGANGPYFAFEFLWWRVAEDSLEYAGREVAVAGSDVPNFELRTADFEYNPGGRVSVGGNIGYDNWDFCFAWTYMQTNTSDSLEGDILGINSFFFEQGGDAALFHFQSARAKWVVQFHNWDFELGRWYFVGNRLSFRPSLGIKGAIIRQHFENRYQGNGVGNTQFSNAVMKTKSRFWGVGPQLGLNGNWYLGSGFNFYGIFRAALLYGQAKAINRGNALDNTNEQQGKRLTRHNVYRVRPMASGAVGLEWSRCFCHWLFFSIHLGWEMQYWWQQWEIPFINDFKPKGDLSLGGIDFGIRFDF
ncbi:MAG: Lpg1974 family pore-forming outer membrane protein [Chlamydiota bacterium]